MNLKLRPEKYFKYLLDLPSLFGTTRTKEILSVNPTIIPHREEAEEVVAYVFDYDANSVEEKQIQGVEGCYMYKESNRITWINIDGLRKADVESVCNHYNVHPLLIEDILSINQRPKMDESVENLFCLLNMLYYNEEKKAVEQEQISVVLGKDYVLSFQEDAHRDVFNPLRDKLKVNSSKIRQRGADYLCYTMLDLIVDNYFIVMEKLGEQIEEVEEEVVRKSNQRSLARITQLRKELIILKRNFAPVRDIINGFLRSDSELLDDRTTKYFKDIYDHIVQAIDLSDNYRDIMVSMQDLYINNVNLKMNEVMKVLAVVTTLMAPLTVIAGIYGMNFDNMPELHSRNGYFVTLMIMVVMLIIMIFFFRKRGWF